MIKTGIAGLIRSGTDALSEVLHADIFTNQLIKNKLAGSKVPHVKLDRTNMKVNTAEKSSGS